MEALGTGQGTWEGNAIAPLRAEWDRDIEPTRRKESLPASFESLQVVVGALNRLDGVIAHVRPPTRNTEFLRLTKPSGYRQWSYLDSARRIRRGVMIIDIVCNGIFGSLVEYERRDSERSRVALFVTREPREVSEANLIQLLDGLVAAEGVWANLKSHPTDVRLEPFNHSRPSAAKFAADLRNAMQKVA